jgi:hypothetical protein
MKNTYFLFVVGLLSMGWWLACNSEPISEEPSAELKASNVNPNGDSELALVMRHMYEDGMLMKARIEAGEPVTSTVEAEKLLTAHATEPEKVASNDYKNFALSYQSSLDQLLKADAAAAPQLYQNMVKTCMNCHKEFCPGPMMRIKNMWLDKSLLSQN